MVFLVWSVGFGVEGLVFGVRSLGLRIQGSGFGVWDSRAARGLNNYGNKTIDPGAIQFKFLCGTCDRIERNETL